MSVWASAGGKRATRFTAAALIGYGAVSKVGLLLFPMDVRETAHSQRDTLHIIDTIVMSIFIVAMMASVPGTAQLSSRFGELHAEQDRSNQFQSSTASCARRKLRERDSLAGRGAVASPNVRIC
jgi:hypothetical protein